MKRILFLLVLLVFGTQTYAVYNIVYSRSELAQPVAPQAGHRVSIGQGYRIDLGLSAMAEEGFNFSAGFGEYKSQDRYNGSIEARAFHFPIYYKWALPMGGFLLFGINNSYWYDAKIEPIVSEGTDYNAYQFWNGYSLQITGAPDNIILQISVDTFEYGVNHHMMTGTIGLGYYFK